MCGHVSLSSQVFKTCSLLAYVEKLRMLGEKVRFLVFLEKLEAVPTLDPHSRGLTASSWGSGSGWLLFPAVVLTLEPASSMPFDGQRSKPCSGCENV